MNAALDAMPGNDAITEATKKAAEDQITENAPGYLKPLFPCLGGPVGTVETCMCTVPADKQEAVKSAIEKYKSV
jgi:hypothetical protein